MLAFLIAGGLGAAPAADQSRVPGRAGIPRVLMLAADPNTSAGLREVQYPLRDALTASSPQGTEFYAEYLDTVFITAPEFYPPLVEWLKVKYADRQPDVIITLGGSALRFAVAERPNLFPEVPIVFGHVVESDLATVPELRNAAGVVSRWPFAEQLDVALRLLPDTRRAVVVLGSGPLERAIEPRLRSAFQRFAGKVAVDWWVGVPMAELESRISKLPPRTVVVFAGIYRDNAGGSFVSLAALEHLARLSSAPFFSVFTHQVGLGIVGDGRVNYGEMGRQVGTIAGRILKGEDPAVIGVTKGPPSTPTFDARQLARWRIPRSRLPEGSTVKFETPSLWEQHRAAVLIGLTVILLQSLLLAGLLTQRLARRRAESAQRESQTAHASLLDSLDERIATLNRDGTIRAANRSWREFAERQSSGGAYGIGQSYLSAVREAVDRGQEDARRTLESLYAVLSGQETARRLEYFAPNRSGVRYEMRIVALYGPQGGALVTIQDITDRWRSEERVRVALESLPLATMILDDSGRIELLNAQAEELFGYHRDLLINKAVGTLIPGFSALIDRESSDGVMASAHDEVASRTVAGRRRDGSNVPVEVHLRAIELGSRPMVLASFIDLSERHRVDSEIQKLREEAAHFGRVAAVGEMSAAIAHELNQPLTGILSNAQAAERFIESGSYSRDDLKETLSDIVADTRRAGEVIQRLRLMLRKGPVESRELDVNEVVRYVVRLVNHDLALRGAVLDLELTENLPRVTGDRVHLQQAILNLILNGADAMAVVPRERRRMLLRTAPGIDQTVDIELRDSGPGISTEALQHLFEPFFTTKPTGLGMGLAIVRTIVENHGGRIRGSNSASGGAVFSVTLPAARREGEAA